MSADVCGGYSWPRLPGAGIIGRCELPDIGAEPKSSAGTTCARK